MTAPCPVRRAEDSVRLVDSAAIWLAFVLVLIKASFLGLPSGFGPGAGFEYLRSLAAITYTDVTFAAVFWAVARLALLPITSPSAAWILSIGWVLGAALASLAAVVNLGIFSVLGGFLTYPLLQLVGNVRMVRSSVAAHMTPAVIASLIVIPLLYLTGTWVVDRWARQGDWSRRRRAAIAGAALIWVVCGHLAFGAYWTTRQERRIAQNAHWVFFSSWLQRGAGRTIQLSDQFTADDLADFEPIGIRAVPPPPPEVRRAAIRTRKPAASAAQRVPAVRAGPPNVILIVLESVAARWTGLSGRGYQTTPTLEAEAAHSIVFDNFYAHIGRSSNSLSAMLLSLYPKLGFRDMTDENPDLPGTSIASVLQDRGYRTGFTTPSALTWAGWDRFLDGRGFAALRDERDLTCGERVSSWGLEDRCLVDDMVEWMQVDEQRPYFLMTWTQQTHHPYEPTPGVPMLALARDPVVDDYGFDRYLNVLHETDRQVARVFAAVRQAGQEQNTIIVVTGDHGQAFGYPHDSFMQGRTIYDEDVRVPLMIWFPRKYRAPIRSAVIGSHVDVAPTIADLAGLPLAPEWQGRSLFDPDHAPRAYFYVAEDEFMLGVREDRWKYILNVRDGSHELFDLSVDADEQTNVAPMHPDICSRLRRRLAAWTEANRRQYLASPPTGSVRLRVPTPGI